MKKHKVSTIKNDVKPSYKVKYKCNRCKEPNITKFKNLKVNITWGGMPYWQLKVKNVSSSFLRTKEIRYERCVYEQQKLYKGCCNNCGKKQLLFIKDIKSYHYDKWYKQGEYS